jgi:hypothetical protein
MLTADIWQSPQESMYIVGIAIVEEKSVKANNREASSRSSSSNTKK